MKNVNYRKLIEKHETAIVIALLIIGGFLRLAFLRSLPYGLNQDEASAGYEAWSLLNYGIDRCANTWPVLLESWGSGQNALYTYLLIPVIALFGLNVTSLRIVSALASTVTLVVFWLLARRCRGKAFGVCALLMLTVNPWHIMSGRWALESNLLPLFLLAGIYFISLSRDREWFLTAAAAAFGLSLYAYGTAFIFLPVFIVLAVIWLRKHLRVKSFLVSCAVFILIALPITACQIINLLDMQEAVVLGVTLPKLTQARQSATTSLGGGGAAAVENYRQFLSILWNQSDGLVYNAVGQGGLYYFFGLPFAVVGLLASIGGRKRLSAEAPMRFAICAVFIAAFIVTPNINRMNMAWLPIIYFSAVGMYMIMKRLKAWSFIPAAALLVCFGLFCGSYYKELGGDGHELYYPGLGEAIEYVCRQDADNIYITGSVNQPYIFALFYSQTPPREFIDTVDYINPDGAFRHVRSFGSFTFGNGRQIGADYLIVRRDEADGLMIVREFGNYAVCLGAAD